MAHPWEDHCPKYYRKFFEGNLDEEDICYALNCVVKRHKVFEKSDAGINNFLSNISKTVIRVLDDLMSNLVNLLETSEVLKTRNADFQIEIDRLTAMLRVRNGKFTEYQKRVNEFNDLLVNLTKEMGELKIMFSENEKNGINVSQSYRKISILDRLMEKLKEKLNSDYEALMAGGSPNFSKYLKKIANLESFSISFQGELRRVETVLRLKLEIKNEGCTMILQETNQLEDLVERVKSDIGKLRAAPLRLGCRIGGQDCGRYLEKLQILVEIVRQSKVTVDELKSSIGADKTCYSVSKKKLVELEVLSKRLQSEIKELELVVASGDNSSLIKRIKELEDSIARLKLELAGKDNSTSSLQQELAGAKIAFRQKVRELETSKSKVGTLADEVKFVKKEVNIKEQQIKTLTHELENLRSKPDLFQRSQNILHTMKSEVQNLQTEKNNIREGVEIIHNFFSKQIEEISGILAQKIALEEKLRHQSDLFKNELEEFRKENVELKIRIEVLQNTEASRQINKQHKECGDTRPMNFFDAFELDNQILKVQIKNANDELAYTNNKIQELMRHLKQIGDEKANVMEELNRYKASNTQLRIEVEIEKTTTKETLKEFDNVVTERDELKKKVKLLKDESEGLSKELKKSKVENCRLKNVNGDVEKDSSVWKSQIEGLKREDLYLCEQEEKLNTKVSSLPNSPVSTKSHLQAEESRNTTFSTNLRNVETNVMQVDRLKEGDVYFSNELKKAKPEQHEVLEELSKSITETCLHEIHSKSRTGEFKTKSQKIELQKDPNGKREKSVNIMRTIESLEAKKSNLEHRDRVPYDRSRHLESDSSPCEKESKSKTVEFPLSNEEKRDLYNIHEELNVLKTTIDEREIEQSRQQEINQSFEQKIHLLCEENSRLEKQSKNEIQMLEVQNKILKADAIILKDENYHAQIELGQTKVEMDRTHETVSDLESANLILNKKIGKLKEEKECLSAEFLKATNILDDKKSEIMRLKNKNDLLASYSKKSSTEAVESKQELEELKQNNCVLKIKIKALQEEVIKLNSIATNYGSSTIEMQQLEEELHALKNELGKTRSENGNLNCELEAFKKDTLLLTEELTRSRKDNAITEEIRRENEQLHDINLVLKDKLQGALKENDKYTIATTKLNGLENKMKAVLKDYTATKKSLHSANEQISDFKRVVTNLPL